MTTAHRILLFILLSASAAVLAACGSSSTAEPEADTNTSGPGDSTLPTITARISTENPSVGDQIEIQLIGENFPLTEGGGVSLKFNSTALQIDHIELDPSWEFDGRPGNIDNNRGEVLDLLFASFAGHSGNIPIATVTATILDSGQSTIEFQESLVSPFGAAGASLAVRLPSISIRAK